MKRLVVAGIVLVAVLTQPAQAQERVTLGWGRLFNNDFLGDMHDRWHTGSYTISRLRGPDWNGSLPTTFGEILEFRLSSETVTPASLISPDPSDRRFAGMLSVGMRTHFDWHGLETSLGADLVVTGPQTGIGGFQVWVHDVLGMDAPSPSLLAGQIPDQVFPTLSAEVGRDLRLSDTVMLHPFVAAQAGVETMMTAGGDLVIGSFGQGALMLRDRTTGQRFRGIEGAVQPAMSFTLGGDVTHVFDTALLPAGDPAVASDTRTRLRAGVQWEGGRSSAFYGITYLGPEFDSQPEGQVVGSINLNFRF